MERAGCLRGLALFLAAFSLTTTVMAADVTQAEIDTLEAEVTRLTGAGDMRSATYLALVEELAIAHHELGAMLSRRGDAGDATAHFRRAYALDRASYEANDPTVLNTGNSLATNLNFLGRYGEAEAILREVLLAAEATSTSGRRLRWTIINTLAGSLTGQNRLRDAEALLREVREQIVAHGTENEGPLARLITNNLAHNLHEQRRYAEADLLLREVAEQYGGARGDTPEAWLAKHNLAANLIDLGLFDEALTIGGAAFASRKAALGDHHPDTLTSQTIVGLAQLGSGDRETAIATLRSALSARREKLGADHPDTLLGEAALADALLRVPEGADEAYPLAMHVTTALRNRMTTRGFGVGDQSQFARDLDEARAAERQLIEAAWHGRAPDREAAAFAAAQFLLNGSTSRAVALKAANRSADAAGLTEAVEKRQSLSAEWQMLDRRLLALAATASSDDLRLQRDLASRRGEAARGVAEIDQLLRARAPDYFALVRPGTLSIEEAKKLLKGDEAALLVLPTDYATHIFLVTREGLTWARSAKNDVAIGRSVTRLLWDVGAKVDIDPVKRAAWEQQGEGTYPYDFVTAHMLYADLVAPVAHQLSTKHVLFIAATGPLASMPFGILVREVPKGPDGDPAVLRSAKWFADEIAQIQIPSLNSLALLRRFRIDRDSSEAQPFLGFGDPVLEGKSALRGASRGPPAADLRAVQSQLISGSETALADPRALLKLSRLPGTAQELNALWTAAGAPGNSLFLAAAATETRVRQTPLNADVIVFATHGLLAQEINGLSEPGLVLSPPTEASIFDDGYLSSSEIAELKIRSKWIILSACNTAGSSGSADSEGLSGLARSFFFAGAPSLLVSHWPVRDAVAPRLTVAATEWLKRNPGRSPAEALQVAMKTVRDDKRGDTESDSWAHPNAWAPFVIVGDR
ncbi:CHAT domain-containing tetratricopeptide repeat protein [Sphingopyxis sp.]|uniref:CHAT domain-containing tetratricopeptide repeat protein n=1 Tax=Sphingopyxis sp. TaxID=1908224 RepID=UPI003BAD8D2A